VQSPADCEPDTNLLFENVGGSFVEVSASRGIVDAAPTLAPLFYDFDADGDLDIYVGNDIGVIWPDQLYINDGSGHFVDDAEKRGVYGPGTDTMGVDVGDYDGDGTIDMVITDFDARPIRLFRCFDSALPCSNEVTPDGTDHVKWGVGFVDFDNDRDLDLFVATGHVVPSEGDPSYLYFGDGAGRWEQHLPADESGVGDRRVSRGAAFGDLDGDGDVDVVIANANDAPQVLDNRIGAGHAIFVQLDARAAGAVVTVITEGGRVLREQFVLGGSFASGNDARMHFGLGAACRAEVSVRYLDGKSVQRTAAAGDTVRF
jgi:hypothetical protein